MDTHNNGAANILNLVTFIRLSYPLAYTLRSLIGTEYSPGIALQIKWQTKESPTRDNTALENCQSEATNLSVFQGVFQKTI